MKRTMTSLTIKSHVGAYSAIFEEDALERLDVAVPQDAHFIIDRRVAELNRGRMANILQHRSVLFLDATEYAKSLDHTASFSGVHTLLWSMPDSKVRLNVV